MGKYWYKAGDKIVKKEIGEEDHLIIAQVVYVDTNGDAMLRFYPEDNPNMICSNPVVMADSEFGITYFYRLCEEAVKEELVEEQTVPHIE